MEPNDTVFVHDDKARMGRRCPQCGETSITTCSHHHTFTYGSGDTAATLEVDLPLRRCGACDLEYLDHEGERLKHEAVCRHLRVLSPAEIRGIRKSLGMTRAVFAEITGLGEATLNRWENGAVVQNLANDRYLRLLALPEIMDRLKALTTFQGFLSEPPGNLKFRVLAVSAERLLSQKRFQLRKAS